MIVERLGSMAMVLSAPAAYIDLTPERPLESRRSAGAPGDLPVNAFI
jgi:hypothetical protein